MKIVGWILNFSTQVSFWAGTASKQISLQSKPEEYLNDEVAESERNSRPECRTRINDFRFFYGL